MDSNVKNFMGTTAFLNGEPKLHDFDQDLFEKFTELGLPVLLLDNLFEEHGKLSRLTECKNLVLFTTGQRREKMQPLFEKFITLNYVPEQVIFLGEGTAMAFLSLARMLKPKGTNFWFVDVLDLETLYEIEWI